MSKEKLQISQLLIERYSCNEVTPAEKERIERALASDEKLRESLQLLQNSTNEVQKQWPVDLMVREIKLRAHSQDVTERMNRAGKSKSLYAKKGILMAAGSSIMALLLVSAGILYTNLFLNDSKLVGEITRIKGQRPYLTVYRETAGGYEMLPDKAVLYEGDRIQLGYVSAGKKYGFIFSVDGSGNISTHFPDEDSTTMKDTLQSGREHLLSFSFELDEAPGFERFFFITSDDTINCEKILDHCRIQYKRGTFNEEYRELPVNNSCEQMTMFFLKGIRK